MTCRGCNGTAIVPETITDSVPQDIYRGLPVRIVDTGRENSWNESHLGMGCVYSCADYGRAYEAYAADPAKGTAMLIADVRSQTYVQACKIARDDGTLCKGIVVMLNRNGYSVRAEY